MRTIELPVTDEWTPELLEGLPPEYAETRVVLVSALEVESV